MGEEGTRELEAWAGEVQLGGEVRETARQHESRKKNNTAIQYVSGPSRINGEKN